MLKRKEVQRALPGCFLGLEAFVDRCCDGQHHADVAFSIRPGLLTVAIPQGECPGGECFLQNPLSGASSFSIDRVGKEYGEALVAGLNPQNQRKGIIRIA